MDHRVVIAHDPSRRSFKQSLIAIAFAGIYFEALLFVVGMARLEARWLREMDRKSYEEKLKALGVTEEDVVAAARRLRLSRNDLVYEKAAPVGEVPHGERAGLMRRRRTPRSSSPRFRKDLGMPPNRSIDADVLSASSPCCPPIISHVMPTGIG